MTFRQLRSDEQPAVVEAAPPARSSSDAQSADVAVRRVYAPLAIWGVAAAVAHALAAPLPAAGPIVAVIAAVCAVRFLRHDLPALALTVAALVPVALASMTPEWTWAASGALIAVAVGRSRRVVSISLNDLERHLTWCRRRSEAADVAYVAFDAASVQDPLQIVHSFRVTDSVMLNRRRGTFEVLAVLDHHTFDRGGLERRINAAAGTAGRWGWARFPDDGLTLDMLLETAHRAATVTAVPSEIRPAEKPQPATARSTGSREQVA